MTARYGQFLGGGYAERHTTKRWPLNDRVVRYVRAVGGDDEDDGLTPDTAWATLKKGLESFAIAGVNRSWILDIAGTFSDSDPLNIGGASLGGINSNLDFGATGPNNFFSYTHGQIRSAPVVVVTPITITGTSTQATTGFYIVNVSNTLVAGAHEGRMLLGQGVVEWARIVANTTNSITICSTTNPNGWAGPIGIYEEGATASFGNASDANSGVQIIAQMDWTISGVSFTKPSAGHVSVLCTANAPVTFQMCKLQGLFLFGNSNYTTIDVCDIYDGFFTQDGASVLSRNSVYRDLNYLCHGAGSTGTNDWIECAFLRGVNPFGGGNAESCFYFNLSNCFFDDFAGVSVAAKFGNSTMTNVLIENSGGDCVQTDGPVKLVMNNVDGATGNAGVGVRAQNGSQVDVSAATSVTGAGGDVVVGSLGTFAYGNLPQTDPTQLVRVF